MLTSYVLARLAPPRGSHPSHNHLNPNSQSLFVSPAIRIHTRNKRHAVSSLESIKPARFLHSFHSLLTLFPLTPVFATLTKTGVGYTPTPKNLRSAFVVPTFRSASFHFEEVAPHLESTVSAKSFIICTYKNRAPQLLCNLHLHKKGRGSHHIRHRSF